MATFQIHIILFSTLLIGVWGGDPQVLDPLVLLESMEDAYEEVSDYTMRIFKEERIKVLDDGEVRFRVHREEADVRFRKRMDASSTSYLRDIYFDRACFWGCPAIYREGHNNGLIDVNHGPDVGPRDPVAMESQHHPITSLDLGETISLVLANVRRGIEGERVTLDYRGEETVDGRGTHHLSFTFDGDSRVHLAEPGQTLWDVAAETGQDMYVILSANEDLAGPEDIVAGDSIRVPDYYAHRVGIWIDEASSMPIRIEIHDAEGNLYERYLYTDLRINVSLTDDHFR